MNNNPPYLLTYPRSGSHYFHELFYKKTKMAIGRSHRVIDVFDHEKNKTKNIVTIIRDPKETLWSLLALQENYGYETSQGSIKQGMSDYILFYNFLFEYADYIIDFNDLIKYPNLVIGKVVKGLEIKEQDVSEFDIEEYKKVVGYRYIPSSKKLSEYDEKSFESFNLGLCYYEYEKLLTKKIIID